MRFCLALLMTIGVLGCSAANDDGVVDVAFIGEDDSLFESGLRLSPGAQHIRAATAEGLVRLDAAGRATPALAERWIVADDGASYIFKLRDSDWPDGSPITGESVRDALQRNIRALQGTSLGLDLAAIRDIRAMTGRVVEIRLTSPMPDFLQLLAQPELGLLHDGEGTGPMTLLRDGSVGTLSVVAPERRGLPQQEDWEEEFTPVSVSGMGAKQANEAFARNEVEVVLNGQIATLPVANTGALARGTVRLEAAIGIFGLQLADNEGFLASAANREALALAIDRPALLEPFNIGGWTPTTRIVAPDLPADSGLVGERWPDLTFAQRQAVARQRVNAWKRSEGSDSLPITIALPAGPGSDRIFRRLAEMYGEIGVNLRRVGEDEPAQLQLRDRTARYGAARWFLNQFHCTLTRGLCSPEADALVAQSLGASDPEESAALLAEAERELAAANYFIPFGAPIRWSLVRADVDGFQENAWAIHPLFPLAGGTN